MEPTVIAAMAVARLRPCARNARTQPRNRSFRRDGVRFVGRFGEGVLLSHDPGLQPGEVQINDRRRVQGKNLAQGQPTHHRKAERPAQL
jgi:hypothetical protein